MRYKLIAVDLDGTLLNGEGVISAANAAAIARAQAAGALVVPCTGRAWRESILPLALMPDPSVGVFVGGAAVTDIATGQSLDLSMIEPHLAEAVVDFLYDRPDALLVFREADLAGHDYLVTGDGKMTPNTKWWFDACGSTVAYADRPRANDLHHTLRIAVISRRSRMMDATGDLVDRFGDQLFTNYFPVVQTQDHTEPMFVLEIFAAGVDKWRGLQWIARGQGIDDEAIAAIGDEINDLVMIENAGCGFAMDNGVERVKAVADHVTHDNHGDGVAYAIGQLLSGEWG